MKILHINTLWGRGGASKSTKLLNDFIPEIYREESDVIVDESFTTEDSIFIIKREMKSPWGYKKLKRIMSKKGFLYYFLPIEKSVILKKVNDIAPDIIHLHNIHGGYFQLNLIDKLSKMAPIVWTFRDMFPLTGHCAYSFECKKWESGCKDCPNLNIYPAMQKDRSAFIWKYKNKIYKKSSFTIVTPSKWLFDCVKKSMLKEKNLRLIYNGVNTEKFRKTDKKEARRKLSLPLQKKIILFSADGGTSNPFKGGEFVLEVYENYKNRDDILFLNVGNNEEKENLSNWKNYKYVTDENEMALLYSAADIYLFPTLAENCPLGVIEAMSCGLSVITFNTGGVPEIVRHMKDGYVAEYKNGVELIKALDLLLNDKNLINKMSISAQKRAREEFDAKIMVGNYYKLYCEILDKKT